MWPIPNAGDISVFDRIVVYVIKVPGEIVLAAQRVFPIAPLPYSALAFGGPADGNLLDGRQGARKCALDQPPSRREIGIVLGESPDRVEVVRQDHSSFNCESVVHSCLAKGRAQQADVVDQQGEPPIGQVDGEEIAAAADKASAVVCHTLTGGPMDFALRSTHPTRCDTPR